MADNNEISTAQLWQEGSQVTINLVRSTPTSITINWVLPTPIKVTQGYVILVHTSPLEVHQRPVDGIRYTPSTDLSFPTDTIGGAQVVAAAYAAFGQAITATSVIVGNADPNLVYYASIHVASNVLQYYPYGSKSYALDGSTITQNVDGYTGNIPEETSAPLTPYLGQVYFNRSANKVFMWNGAAWIQASSGTVQTGQSFPTNPTAGDFFYQLNTHILFIWNGSSWTQANTSQVGTPSYDKVAIGTTGSIDERVRLVNELKAQLGWPAVCVELSEENFDVAINLALSEFRRRSDSAYERRHVLFSLKPNQSNYYLNDPSSGTDRIVDIFKIHRVSTIGLNVLGGDNGIYAQIFYNQFFYGSMIDILSIHLANSLAEEFEKIFAGTLMFDWHEATRELMVLRKLYKEERVVLECYMERTEQELLADRWAKNWIRDWALAKCWEMLGMSRTKYGTLPGANGGLSLNGDTLLSRAETMFTELQRQINDYEVGNLSQTGNCAFIIG